MHEELVTQLSTHILKIDFQVWTEREESFQATIYPIALSQFQFLPKCWVFMFKEKTKKFNKMYNYAVYQL